ncbi:MAG: PAS domain S-box protein [Candidatus Kerfeldbacteria bacterium]|nr:PAS domain S-box protein [Candidatus Kerfeldbacteria bacterium]
MGNNPKDQSGQEWTRISWRQRLNTKLLLWFFMGAMLPVLIVGFWSLDVARQSLLSVTLRDARVDSQVFAQRTHESLEALAETVIDLSRTPAAVGLARAQGNEGLDPVDGTTVETWANRLAEEFRSLAEEALEEEEFVLYPIFRYVDTRGQEMVRLEVTMEGEIERTPTDELGSVTDRDFFVGTMAAGVGGVYRSRLEYNQDVDPKETIGPHQSVIRSGTPVVDDRGVVRGAVVVSHDPEFFLEHLYPDADKFGPVDLAAIEELKLLIDADGYYLLHPDLDKRWGGPLDLGTGINIKTEFPAIGDSIFGSQLRQMVDQEFAAAQVRERVTEGKPTVDGEITLFSDFAVHYRPIFPDPDDRSQYWIEVHFLPGRLVISPVRDLQRLLLMLVAAFAGMVIVTSYLASRTISRPVTALQRGVEIIQGGNLNHRVAVTGQDEIGRLGRAFNHMTASLKDLYDNLEDKVRARTAEVHKFQQAVESSTDGVMMMTPQAEIAYVNPAWQRQSGFPAAMIIGQNLDRVISEHTPLDVRQQLRRHLQEGQPFFSEAIFARRQDDQEYQIQLSIVPVHEDDRVVFLVGLQQDITQRMEVDKAKTEFVSLASHQLRTPLSTINWYTERLLGGDLGPVNESQQKYLQEIYDSNQRMTKLVNDLLNVSRLELGTFVVEPEPTDIKRIIHETITDLTALIQHKRLTVDEQYDRGLQPMSLDPNLMRLIIQNLVTNAAKYTSEGGHVSIIISLAKEGQTIEDQRVTVPSLVAQVADNGVGIPADQQSKIFTKLFRADNAREKVPDGTGLGLYMVKSIIDHSGGRIWFRSKENRGSTFVVAIPLSGMKKKAGTKPLTT